MTLALLVEQLFNGVQFGLMLFLMAVGVTLVFGIMRVINLAHGSLFMIGGYFLMAALAWTQSYVLAVPLAFIGGALVAIVLEIVVLRPLYRRGAARPGAGDVRADAVLQRGGHRDLGPRVDPAEHSAVAHGLGRDHSGRRLSGLSARHHRRRDRRRACCSTCSSRARGSAR